MDRQARLTCIPCIRNSGNSGKSPKTTTLTEMTLSGMAAHRVNTKLPPLHHLLLLIMIICDYYLYNFAEVFKSVR